MTSPPPRGQPTEPKALDLVLHTNRLTLRPFRDGDVEDLWPWVSDPAFPRQMSWAAHVDRAETMAFIAATRAALASGKAITWAIEHDGKASGCIGIDNIKWAMRAWRVDRGEVGYWIAPPLWGQGLMTEATHAVARFAFDVVGLHKLTIGCIADNDASRRVIEKVGFRPVGRLEDDVWRDGKWMAHLRYELLANEYDDTTSTRRFTRKPQ